MSAKSIALESLAEHDRRVRWERRRKEIMTLAEWLLAIAIAGAIGALIAYPYGYDAGKAAAVKRDSEVRDGFSCRGALQACLNQMNAKRKAT